MGHPIIYNPLLRLPFTSDGSVNCVSPPNNSVRVPSARIKFSIKSHRGSRRHPQVEVVMRPVRPPPLSSVPSAPGSCTRQHCGTGLQLPNSCGALSGRAPYQAGPDTCAARLQPLINLNEQSGLSRACV